MRSARALPGFRGFGGSVRSRVARSIARLCRDARYDEADAVPTLRSPRSSERDRTSESEGSRTRKRGRRRFSRVRLCWRSSRHAPAPLPLSLPFRPPPPPLPDAAASFGAFFSTVVQPSSTIARVSTERAVAAKRRFRLVALLAECAAGARGRRRRRRRVRSRTGSLRRAGEYRGASTERGDVHERAPNAVARENDCAFGRRRHSTFSQTERGPLHFRPTLPHTSRESSKNAKRGSCRQVV